MTRDGPIKLAGLYYCCVLIVCIYYCSLATIMINVLLFSAGLILMKMISDRKYYKLGYRLGINSIPRFPPVDFFTFCEGRFLHDESFRKGYRMGLQDLEVLNEL